MARILLLARQFPPIGGAGVQRSIGHAALLGDHGHEVTVVTGPAQYRDRFNPRDDGLLAGVPEGVAVHRVAGPEPAGRGPRRERIDRLLQAPAPWTTWWVREVAVLAERVGRQTGAELVLTSCNPYETATAGQAVARALGVPWVADLEDPWALDEMRVHPTAVHRARDRRRMRRALAGAAAVLFCDGEAALRARRAFPELAGRPVVSIPIGFDAADFAAPVPAPAPDVLRIVHTGTIHTELGERHRRTRRARRLLGGSGVDVDILPRSPVFLLEAVDRVLAEQPQLTGRIEVHLIGELTAGDRAILAGRPYVRDRGPMPHARTVAEMREAGLLFLPMHDVSEGSRVALTPYKTFEYLAAARPILAALPDGDARDLLGAVRQAALVRPGDVTGMAGVIARAAAGDPPGGGHLDGPDAEPVARLERRRSEAAVAALLEDVLRGEGSADAASHAELAAGVR